MDVGYHISYLVFFIYLWFTPGWDLDGNLGYVIDIVVVILTICHSIIFTSICYYYYCQLAYYCKITYYLFSSVT